MPVGKPRRESRDRLRSKDTYDYGTLSASESGHSSPYVSIGSRGVRDAVSVAPGVRNSVNPTNTGNGNDDGDAYQLLNDDGDGDGDDKSESTFGGMRIGGRRIRVPGRERCKLWLIVASVLLSACMLAFAAAYIATHATSALPSSTGPGGVPDGFVPLRSVVTSVVEEMRYHGSHNFVGRPIAGYDAPVCWVTKQAAEALRRAGDLAAALDPPRALKVYDCYRPMRAVADFVSWGRNATNDAMKREFYPALEKSDLFPTYIATKSGHSRGSTVDITLVPMPAPSEPKYVPGVTKLVPCTDPVGDRWRDNSVAMPTGFDCFSPQAWTNSTAAGVTGAERANRETLVAIMKEAGLDNYPEEWWHYTLRDEPFPDTYFDFPVVEPPEKGAAAGK